MRSKRGASPCETVRRGATNGRRTNRSHSLPKPLTFATLCHTLRRGATRCDEVRKWGRWDSNPEPTDYELRKRHFAEVAKPSVCPRLASPSRSLLVVNDVHILPRSISDCDRFSDRSLTHARSERPLAFCAEGTVRPRVAVSVCCVES